MPNKHVLILTNAMTDDEIKLIGKFIDKKPACQTFKLSLVHVIPRLPAYYFNTKAIGNFIGQYYDEALISLHKVGNLLNIIETDQWLISGKLRSETLRLANKLNVDFILANASQITNFRSLFFKDIKEFAKQTSKVTELHEF